MRLLRLAPVVLVFAPVGCHSAFVDATISNRTAAAIPLIEVDYPSASFGTQNLAPGAEFHYRFKVLGNGPLKVVYTDATQREKSSAGPSLSEGDEGPLTLTFTADGPHWQALPTKR